MSRSAKMKLMTPPKLMPPFHSTAASGTLPIEQTKLSTETTGPTRGPQTFDQNGWSVRNRCCQKLSGTQAATAPAISSPMTMSRRTAAHSMTKTCATDVKPAGERRRCQQAAVTLDAHVHRGVALHRPGEPSVGLDPRVARAGAAAGTAGRAARA